MSNIRSQTNDLLAAISQKATVDGDEVFQKTINAASEIQSWLHYYKTHATSKSARELLEGARAAILESAGYAVLGLGRASIAAIRTQIDLILCFTYFGDHPKEWGKVINSGDGFKLRSDIYSYHKDIDKGFATRLSMLDQISKPTLEDVYKVLSAHIHGQAPLTMPNAKSLSDLVVSNKTIESIIGLQEKASISLSNFLTTVHAPEWTSLPKAIVDRVSGLLTVKQRPQFFE